MEKAVHSEIPSKEYKISESECSLFLDKINHLGYAPDNEYYTKLMVNVTKNVGMELFRFANETELKNWTQNQSQPVAAVLFEEVRNLKFDRTKNSHLKIFSDNINSSKTSQLQH